MFQRQNIPNLNLLRIFEAAGRHLSFKAAAEELFVTPSAVSQQVKALEEQLGVALFLRKNRALEFTAIGKGYWLKIHLYIEGIHQTTSELIESGQKELAVSIMPPVANRVVLPNLNSFHQRHPNINLRIDASLKNLDILKGEADVAVRFGEAPWEGLAHEKLSDVSIQVVCPPGFTEQFQLQGNPDNLKNAPLIHMSERPEVWGRWFKDFNLGAPLNKQHFFDDYPSAIQAAESLGAAIALMPLESKLVECGRLEAPFPAVGPIDESIYAVYRAGNAKDETIQIFIQWLKEELEQLQ